jgi:hypothetical protein
MVVVLVMSPKIGISVALPFGGTMTIPSSVWLVNRQTGEIRTMPLAEFERDGTIDTRYHVCRDSAVAARRSELVRLERARKS